MVRLKPVATRVNYGSPYEYTALTREEKSAALFHSGLVGFKSRNVSGDANLWCREFESGVLDDPESFVLSESLFTWSKWDTSKQLDKNQIKIGFRKGYPVTINDLPMSLKELIAFINNHVGAYEIGRYVGFDHLDEDEKVLEVREAPAANILMKAYKLLETATLPTDVLRAKAMHNEMWTQEAVEGRWGSLLQSSCYAFIAHTAESISGSVLFSLSRGQVLATSIVAEHPRYLRDRDAWEVKVAKQRSQRALTVSDSKARHQNRKLGSSSMETIKSPLQRHSSVIARLLADNDYVFISGKQMTNLLSTNVDEVIRFKNCWNHLERDRYMADGGAYRYRRYGQFNKSKSGHQITMLPHEPYVQPAYINHLNGDIERHFEPLTDRFVTSPVLEKTIAADE